MLVNQTTDTRLETVTVLAEEAVAEHAVAAARDRAGTTARQQADPWVHSNSTVEARHQGAEVAPRLVEAVVQQDAWEQIGTGQVVRIANLTLFVAH